MTNNTNETITVDLLDIVKQLEQRRQERIARERERQLAIARLLAAILNA